MKAEIKAEWIRRLRSGEIEQTYHRLGTMDGDRCCLGVLCDIAHEQGVVTRVGQLYEGSVAYNGESLSLPDEVLEWAGLPTINDGVKFSRNVLIIETEESQTISKKTMQKTIPSTLAGLNDARLNFEEIADVIEAYL